MKVSKLSSNPTASMPDPSPPLHTGRDSVSQRSPIAADCQAPEAVRGGAEARRFPFPSLPSISLSGRRGHGRRAGGGGGGHGRPGGAAAGAAAVPLGAAGGPGRGGRLLRHRHGGRRPVVLAPGHRRGKRQLRGAPQLDRHDPLQLLQRHVRRPRVRPAGVDAGKSCLAAGMGMGRGKGKGRGGRAGEAPCRAFVAPLSRLCRRNWSFGVPCTLMQVLGWCRLCRQWYRLHSVN